MHDEIGCRLCFSTFFQLYLSHCNTNTDASINGLEKQIMLFINAFYIPYERRFDLSLTPPELTKISKGYTVQFSSKIPNVRHARDDSEEFEKTLDYVTQNVITKFPNVREKEFFAKELCCLVMADKSINTDFCVDFTCNATKQSLLAGLYEISVENLISTIFLYVARLNFKFGNAKESALFEKQLESIKIKNDKSNISEFLKIRNSISFEASSDSEKVINESSNKIDADTETRLKELSYLAENYYERESVASHFLRIENSDCRMNVFLIDKTVNIAAIFYDKTTKLIKAGKSVNWCENSKKFYR